MALMATALPPTQMSVLPSIVDASSKTAAAPTEAGATVNGGSTPVQAPVPAPDQTNATNGSSALIKPQANGSRQSMTTNTVLERSPSSNSQILVPSNLKSSLPKLVGDVQGTSIVGCAGNGASPYQSAGSGTSLLSVAVVSNNGKVIQQQPDPSPLYKPNLMLTFEGETSKASHTCGICSSPTATATTITTTASAMATTTTTSTATVNLTNETKSNSDNHSAAAAAEDDVIYSV